MIAILYRTLDIISILVEHGADATATNIDGTSALYIAAGHNLNPEVIKILLFAGANVQGNDPEWVPLLAACTYNSFEVIKELVEAGADVNSRGMLGQTPLIAASTPNRPGKPDPRTIKLLLDHGADANAIDNLENTPLSEVVQGNSLEAVKLLIKAGADLHFRTKDGRNILRSAAFGTSSLDILKLLLSLGLDIEDSILSAACGNPNPEIFDFLLARDEPIDRTDGAACTLLHLAAERNTPMIVEYLIRKGLDVNAVDDFGNTPLLYAATRAGWHVGSNSPNPKPIKIMRCLVSHGANLESRDRKGRTPLMVAIQDTYATDTPLALIDLDSHVNTRDYDGMTPFLSVADQRGYWDKKLIKALLDHGAKVNARNKDGNNALHLIAQRDYTTAKNVDFFASLGVDPKSRNKLGLTPLMLAAKNPNINLEVFSALLKYSPDFSAKDKNGYNVLFLAIKYNQWDIIKLLLDAGAPLNVRDPRGNTPLMVAMQLPASLWRTPIIEGLRAYLS